MTFRFPCERALTQQLGELDALCECIELATRDLIERASMSHDHQTFIGNLSQQHGIRVNKVDVPALRPHIARMYVVTVHQRLEEFLISLQEQHPRGEEWDMTDDADRLTKIARAVGLKATLSFALCQHYRTIRNATMHPDARENVRKRGVDPDLRARTASDLTLCKLAAPNSYDQTSFDDFVLFTRSAKTIARELCETARPSDEQLAVIAKEQTADLGGRLRENPKRLALAQSGFLQTAYSLSKPEADRIVAGLLA